MKNKNKGYGVICARRAKQEIVPFMILDLLTGCNNIPKHKVQSDFATGNNLLLTKTKNLMYFYYCDYKMIYIN